LTLALWYDAEACRHWTDDDARRVVPRRSLGRVKPPTGAAEMRLSPEMIELIRTDESGDTPAAAAEPAGRRDRAGRRPAPPIRPASTIGPRAVGPSETVELQAAHSPQSPAVAPATAQVMSSFLHTMDRFLGIEQTLIRSVGGDHDTTPGYGHDHEATNLSSRAGNAYRTTAAHPDRHRGVTVR
jgi:hypothetical protein